jgi:FkbM family methyltransferase
MTGGSPKERIKKSLRSFGLELQRFDPEGSFAKRRQRRLAVEEVDVALDVGAHAGEFGKALRHSGFAGRILSFEPLAQHYARLQEKAADDALWDCRQTAIGDRNGTTVINVSGNDGLSSSAREMTGRHETGAPGSAYVGTENVPIATLDEATNAGGGERPFLKVDTQGFEPEVLAGGTETLRRCRVVELELGFVELYAGQALFADLVEQMRVAGMVLTDLEPAFRDETTGELLQVDALFTRPPGP